MSERAHLLIVDDDREIRGLLAQYLEKHDFRTTAVADGKEMRRVMERSHVDLLVLDLMLPGEDGLSLCRELRARSQVPIIMLTARGEDVDRIVGLELGADDYLGKPFNPRELLGRIKAILRRTAHAPRDPSPESVRGFSFGGWRLDTITRTLADASAPEVAPTGAEHRAQAAGLFLIAQERERFVLQGSVREWARRIAETTLMLQALDGAERAAALGRLSALPEPSHLPHPPPVAHGHPGGAGQRGFVRLPLLSDFERTLEDQVHSALGPAYLVEVSDTPEPARPAIAVPVPFFEAHELATHPGSARHYDVSVRLPDGAPLLFRVESLPEGAPLPRHLFANLGLLLLILVIVLYVAARNITRPLSELARAAHSVGRDARPAQLQERGARELRDAARAFNTMQDRLRRYLDSRTRVLAAMSHDTNTPLD